MIRETSLIGLEETRRVIETHRAWTARAFCMATAELRGSFEPHQQPARTRDRQSRRAMLALELEQP
jgi:hypothetical protein